MTYIQPNSPFGPAKKVGSTKDDDKAGGSNAGTYESSEGPFCGPSGGSPQGTYPIGSEERGQSAIDLAHNAPNPSGIKACVYSKYPSLKKEGAAQRQSLTSGSTKKEVKAVMQDLPNKGETNVVGGAGPLGWVVGTGAKVAKGIFNFLKSTPNQAIRNTRRSSYTPAQKVEAMNLLKKLKKPRYQGDGSMGQNLNI